ncbi:MAG: tetratricopeptide repeat protein [Candidatus Obscuribacter sp.]|nr:tetratricopeptide repeat protein [Candidatus Obscuribacter sp.]
MALLAAGKATEAEPHIKHSYEARNKSPINASAVFANSLNGMALLELNKKNYQESENYARQAVQIRLNNGGERQWDLIPHLNTLAEVLIAKGKIMSH